MAGVGQFTSADGPGGRASRFLDAVVAFVVAIFHPIFRVFASDTNSPSTSPSHPSQPPINVSTNNTMNSQSQNRSAHPHGPKEVNANAAPVKVTLPHKGPPNGAVKQENVALGSSAPSTNDSRELADATNGAKLRDLGQEQAEENRQEQLTLPPPVQSVDEKTNDAPEDPAIAAERAIHHGFMNQALDMVSHILSRNVLPSRCSVSKTRNS